MATTPSWFTTGPMRGKFAPNEVITTTQPFESRWRILEALKEHNEQKPNNDREQPSFASIRFSCCSLNRAQTKDEDDDILSIAFALGSSSLEQKSQLMDPNNDCIQRRAEMRVYFQVPFTNTENEAPEVRALQAVAFTPPELEAYKALSDNDGASKVTPALLAYEEGVQADWCPVPGGFYTIVVWEFVPGVHLCEGPFSPFWAFDKDMHERILAAFREAFPKLAALGILHYDPSRGKLVWDEKNDALYFVGWRTPFYWPNWQIQQNDGHSIPGSAPGAYGLIEMDSGLAAGMS